MLATGCASQASPDLLEITSVGPPTLESGSEIRILGAGFPDGRRGVLFLDGSLHTPARRPRNVEWSFPLIADSQGEITLRLGSRDLSERLQDAAHATFRGDARVEFEPVKKGRPILKGTKKELVLDLFGEASGPTEDPSAFVTFLGVEINDELNLTNVIQDSPASRAGLQAGDRLLVLDGVRLDSARDLLPQAASRSSVLEIARPGQQARLQTIIERQDFQLLDRSMAARAIAVFVGVLLALLWTARPPRFFLWLFGDRCQTKRTPGTWLFGVSESRRLLALPIFMAILLGYFWLLSSPHHSIQKLAFIGSLALGAFLLLLSSFLLGGSRSGKGGFSLTGALGSAFLRALMLIPIALGSFGRASEVGSLHLGELATDQGTWPTEWGLFASPWSFILAVSYFVALVPVAGRRAPLFGHPGHGTGALFSRLIEWAGGLSLLSLWIVLFLGGAGANPGSLLSGTLLSLKIALVAHALRWTQMRSGGLRLSESWSLFGLPQILVSAMVFAMSFAATFLGLSSRHGELLGLFGLTLAVSSALLVFVSSQRSWAHRGRRVDLWI